MKKHRETITSLQAQAWCCCRCISACPTAAKDTAAGCRSSFSHPLKLSMPCQKEWNNQSKSIRGLPNIIWNLFSIMQGLKKHCYYSMMYGNKNSYGMMYGKYISTKRPGGCQQSCCTPQRKQKEHRAETKTCLLPRPASAAQTP